MNSSLYTGVMGLKNHQLRMDVIGNNIANINTYGYKRGRATFADLLSRTYTGAASPRNGRGGVNPLQVGLGMTTAAVTNIMNQGQLEMTGRLTDVAIDGNGWFVLQDGSGETVYTRDGAFGLDRDGSLVNANGWYVQGWTRIEVDNNHNFSVDTSRPVDQIDFQYGEKLAAAATTKVGLKCNLDEETRSLIADGIDPKEGFATKNDLLVDLYDDDGVNPNHLGVREGDWLEIHVDTTYINRQVATPYGATPLALTGGVDVYGDGQLWRYTGKIDSSLLPILDDIDVTLIFNNLPGGITRTKESPDQIRNTNTYSFDPSTGEFYVGVAGGAQFSPFEPPTTGTQATLTVGDGTDVNADGTLWSYTPFGAEIPIVDDASIIYGGFIAGLTRVISTNPQAVAGDPTSFILNATTGTIYIGAAGPGEPAVTGSTIDFSYIDTSNFTGITGAVTQASGENTLPYETNKYLYFQVTNDTTIGNLETAIQNALDAIDVNGTLNYTVSYRNDDAKFYIYNNPVSGARDYNDLHVEINAVSGSGIRQGYMLRDSTYDLLTGKQLGLVNGGLGGAMTREHVANFDYQTSIANLDYGKISGEINNAGQIYGQVIRSYLTATYVAATADLDVAAGDWTGYTAGDQLQMLDNTAELSVDGSVWRRVNNFTGAANEYRISSAVAGSGVPAVVFNLADSEEPQAGASLVFTYRTDGAPNKLLAAGTDYSIDTVTGSLSLMWNTSTATAVFGASTGAGTGGGFTGTIRLTADYTTEDRALTPAADIMNSRWADFAQEWADVTAGGASNDRTAFNSMFAAINASRSDSPDGIIYDQGTTTQPTQKSSTRFQSAEVYRTSIDVFDSLGEAHTLQFIFTHVGSNYDLTQQERFTNRWYWRAELPYEDVFSFDSLDKIDRENATASCDGQLTFNENGLVIHNEISGNAGPIMFDPSPVGSNGASTHATDTLSMVVDFEGNGKPIDGVTQFASQFTTRAYEQNGWAMGILETFAVDQSGIIEGRYSNNVVKPIAQIALAMFANQEGLSKEGDNVFAVTANSGLAEVVPAFVSGAGSINGGSLEQSNVDIVEEFTSMIITERGFQANSRVITTSDEMLTEVINLKR